MFEMDKSNQGGIGAKKGFFYQDYFATLLVTRMLLDREIKGVGCEVFDDIDIYHSDNSVTYVQVKTGTVDKEWTLNELKKPRNKTSKGGAKPHSSILHKSLELDKNKNLRSKFMLVTDKPLYKSLKYLQLPFESRFDSNVRDKLISQVDRALGKSFESKNGNRGGYWVNNTLWEVFYDDESIGKDIDFNIRKYSEDVLGKLLTIQQVSNLGALICNEVYRKSQIFKSSGNSSDKIIFRSEMIKFVNDNLKVQSGALKVYPKEKAQRIVSLFHKDKKEKCVNKGYKQTFHFSRYRYDYIVDQLLFWIDEVIMKPKELANVTSLISATKILKDRLKEEDLGKVISKTIFNSILRTESDSQPIPMVLFSVGDKGSFTFDAVNILLNESGSDELWISTVELIKDESEIESVIDECASKINKLILEDVDYARSLILDAKDDLYLYKHDVDDILSSEKGLMECVDRFNFSIFFVYSFSDYSSETTDDELIRNISNYFLKAIDRIDKEVNLTSEVRIGIYFLPIPCCETLISKFKEKVGGAC